MIPSKSILRRTMRAIVSATLAVAVSFAAHAGGPADQAVRGVRAADATNDRFIIRLRDPAADVKARLPSIASRSGRSFSYLRPMSGGAHVVRITLGLQDALTTGRSVTDARRLVAQRLMRDPEVAYAEPDRLLVPMLVPNDPLYAQQWNYFEAVGGIDLPAAWDITTGSAAIVVALLDTGVRPHADLIGRTVQGYDFIGDPSVSNDGDGRDADPNDPGDYGCDGSASSWHGTHVAGTLGASSNNAFGVTGVNWVSKILPARVLGRCGGYLSDVADAMRWSAGIAVAGVPANANPARVVNMSLGGTETCSNTMQSAIDDVAALGMVVVVAAGNENADVATSEPANCVGVIAVGATTRSGSRASFSNYGAGVTISAPGTDILSTLNSGTTTPGADSYAFYSGTSMATPHVAGVVSLMLSQNPALTPAQVKARLQQTARVFPTGTVSDCTTALCGAGIVDAAAALALAAVGTRVNLAAQANGAVATASSTYGPGFSPSSINDGDRRSTNGGANGWWNDANAGVFPDWVQIDFPRSSSIAEIDVYSIRDDWMSSDVPNEATIFTQYGVTSFESQYWNGSQWLPIPGGSVSSTNHVLNEVAFTPITTTSIRVQVNASADGYSRIAEVEAYGDGTPSPATPVNVARPFNGGTAVASSTYSSDFPVSAVIDGDRRGFNWGAGGGWNDGTSGVFPDFVQVNFETTKSIGEIDVFTLQDDWAHPQEPTETMTFAQYGVTDFDVQYWNGSAWVLVPGGSISGTNKVWTKLSFSPVATNAIRVNVRNSLDGFSRITEIEAYLAQ